MLQTFIKRYIVGHMGTRRSKATCVRLSQPGRKVTRKCSKTQILWEGAHQMSTGRKVNDRLGEIELTITTMK